MHLHLSNKKNPLLVPDDVGKARKTCYDLPEFGFSYGIPSNPDAEGCREVTMNWVTTKATVDTGPVGPNFININKKAIAQGKSVADLRAVDDKKRAAARAAGKAKPAASSAADRGKRGCVLDDPSFTYGVPARPSTPILSVISGQYAAEGEFARNLEWAEFEREKKEESRFREATGTKASEGHAKGTKAMLEKLAIKEDTCTKNSFKLTKFKKIPSRVGDVGLKKHGGAAAAQDNAVSASPDSPCSGDGRTKDQACQQDE